MINLENARRQRDIRYQVQQTMEKSYALPHKIASRLSGLNYEDMSTAEKQIANLLGNQGYLFFDENKDCHTL